MKTQWKKIAAVSALVIAAPASAIPVAFDFSGTVVQVIVSDFTTGGGVPTFDLSTAGQAFSARFTIDTDLFGPAVSGPSALGDRLLFNGDLPGAVTASLLLNGEDIDLAPYSRNRANAGFLDSAGLVSCGENCTRIAPDQVNVNVFSDDLTAVGIAASRSLSFSYVADFQGTDNPESAMSWFDFTPDFGLDQLALLPLLDSLRLNLSLADVIFACTDVSCQQTGSRRTQFNVTSATRTVASVPEPATLGLLAFGIAAAMGTRRRKLSNA